MDIRALMLNSLGYETVNIQRLSENRAVEQSDLLHAKSHYKPRQ